MTRPEAERIVCEYILRQSVNAVNFKKDIKDHLKAYVINERLQNDTPLQTIIGPLWITEEISKGIEVDPAEWAFFIDDEPMANWQHRCRYVFVHESGRVSVVSSTAPPSFKGHYTITEICNLFSEDRSH